MLIIKQVPDRQPPPPPPGGSSEDPVRRPPSEGPPSVHSVTGPVARSPLTSSSAARIAVSSARVLEHRLPAATRTSRLSPDLVVTSAPPLRETPPSAEPSLRIHVASAGRALRRVSAASRLTAFGASRLAVGPRSSLMSTRSLLVHGGSSTWRRSSTGCLPRRRGAAPVRPASASQWWR